MQTSPCVHYLAPTLLGGSDQGCPLLPRGWGREGGRFGLHNLWLAFSPAQTTPSSHDRDRGSRPPKQPGAPLQKAGSREGRGSVQGHCGVRAHSSSQAGWGMAQGEGMPFLECFYGSQVFHHRKTNLVS